MSPDAAQARRARAALLAVAVLSAAFVLLAPRIPQDPAYHDFADRRPWLGVPDAGDVLGNLAFLPAGVAGLLALRRRAAAPSPAARTAWATFFAGVVLTTFGSGWYHLAPSNERLAWDRLPIALACQGLLCAMIAERLSPRLAARLLVPLLLFAGGSVAWWAHTEAAGAGDLRAYGVSQFGPALGLVLLAVLAPRRESGRPDLLWGVIALYAAAKACEALDRPIFAAGGLVSGHTLKHLFAAVAAGWAARALWRRVTP
ncbi:MAG TPA: alkaline phytoceramidase [Planctomycetota bacterium]|nr:alkaline phytoceramidase [Planctomycetota bacterium]